MKKINKIILSFVFGVLITISFQTASYSHAFLTVFGIFSNAMASSHTAERKVIKELKVKIYNLGGEPIKKKNVFQTDRKWIAELKKQLEELDENSCKWPIGHPDEENFYFCGRTSLKDFSYCKLHLLYAYQPKGKKEDTNDKDEVPEFIEKKIQSA